VIIKCILACYLVMVHVMVDRPLPTAGLWIRNSVFIGKQLYQCVSVYHGLIGNLYFFEFFAWGLFSRFRDSFMYSSISFSFQLLLNVSCELWFCRLDILFHCSHLKPSTRTLKETWGAFSSQITTKRYGFSYVRLL